MVLNKTLRKNILADIVFFAATYISFMVHKDALLFHIFGLAFLISGIYGVLCITKEIRFIFTEGKSSR